MKNPSKVIGCSGMICNIGWKKHIILFMYMRVRSPEFLKYITDLMCMSWQNCHSTSGFLHADLRKHDTEIMLIQLMLTKCDLCNLRCGVHLTASGTYLWVGFVFSCLHFYLHRVPSETGKNEKLCFIKVSGEAR